MAKVVLNTLSHGGSRTSYTGREFLKEGATAPRTAPLLLHVSSSCIMRRPLLFLERSPCSSVSPVFAKPGARFALYDVCDNYVLIEPGKDELFVDLHELRARLRKWLENWPDSSLPTDLARFDDLDEAVTYLVDSACELEISDGSGTVQWFEVRL